MTAPARLRLVLALAVALGPLAGCTFDRGDAFGTLDATLDAHLATPADRDLGDGFQKLASDWQVRVVRFELVVDAVLVEATAEAAATATFDPAAPPPGYGLCHNGHCHADDGRLVDYADIAAELATEAAGGAQLAAVIDLDEVDLLDRTPRPLDCGRCALDEGRLVGVRLVASRLEVELEVRDGRATPRVAGTFVARGAIELVAGDDTEGRAPGELAAVLDAPVGDDAEPIVDLDLTLSPDVSLLDRVDFTTLPVDGTGARDLSAAHAAVRAAFDTLELDARVTRRAD